MPSFLTQIRVLELEPPPDPILGLLCLLLEPQDCARGLAPAVEPKGQVGAVVEREEEEEQEAAVEEEEEGGEAAAAAVAPVALGTRLDGSFTSQKEQSFSTRKGNWI